MLRLTCHLEDGLGRPPVTLVESAKTGAKSAWSTPVLWNVIPLHFSRKAHGSQFRSSEIGSCEQIHRHSSSSWHLTTNTNPYFALSALSWTVLVIRSTYWKSLHCLLPPQCRPSANHSTCSFLLQSSLTLMLLQKKPWEQLRRFKTQFLTVAECLKVKSFPKSQGPSFG